MTKSYPTEVVLSLTTGILLCDFADMHECAEFLTGGSVWTHQFAHKGFNDEMRAALYEQHPELTDVDATDVGQDNWRAFRDQCLLRFGDKLRISPMTDVKTRGQSFAEPLSLIGSARKE